jgi:hypothetical protein
VWVPVDKEAVLKEAVVTPPVVVTFTGLPAVPSMANTTVPAGVPAPGAVTLTVAVKVTFWPGADGFAEDATVVLVPALPTVCVSVPLLVAKVASPEYTALTVCPATDKVLMAVLVATPLLFRLTGVPKFAVSIINCTVPVGVPPPEAGVTVAVKVTLWPNTDGFTEEVTAVAVPLLPTVCVSPGEMLLAKLLSPL